MSAKKTSKKSAKGRESTTERLAKLEKRHKTLLTKYKNLRASQDILLTSRHNAAVIRTLGMTPDPVGECSGSCGCQNAPQSEQITIEIVNGKAQPIPGTVADVVVQQGNSKCEITWDLATPGYRFVQSQPMKTGAISGEPYHRNLVKYQRKSDRRLYACVKNTMHTKFNYTLEIESTSGLGPTIPLDPFIDCEF